MLIPWLRKPNIHILMAMSPLSIATSRDQCCRILPLIIGCDSAVLVNVPDSRHDMDLGSSLIWLSQDRGAQLTLARLVLVFSSSSEIGHIVRACARRAGYCGTVCSRIILKM